MLLYVQEDENRRFQIFKTSVAYGAAEQLPQGGTFYSSQYAARLVGSGVHIAGGAASAIVNDTVGQRQSRIPLKNVSLFCAFPVC